MKKVLSLVLALIMVLSLSAVAFAKTVDEYQTTADNTVEDEGRVQLGVGDEGSDAAEKNPDKPGATYYFTLLKETEDEDGNPEMFYVGVKEDDDYIKHLKVSIKESGDEMMKDYAIVKHNDVYKLKVTTKAYYTVAKKSATWTITGKRNDRLTVLSAKFSPVQAWEALGAEHYDYVDDEEYVWVVDNCAPEGCNQKNCVDDGCEDVHFGDSFEAGLTDDHNLGTVVTLKKGVKYFEIYAVTGNEYDVWFSGKNTHKVSGVMMFNTDVAKELWTANDAEEIEAVDFTGDFEFDYAAIQHVSAPKDYFVYAVEGGKLVAGKFEWNKDAECWETKTMAPIDVIVSDVELKNASAAADKANPGTGSVDFVNVAVALGVVSLAAAGAVALKK
ncbi:MAG: hypothetical protein IJE98_06225 [Oscillospiraceae bacterium]|nr:hypothetical protein [Oscillospiraceae bacterium]